MLALVRHKGFRRSGLVGVSRAFAPQNTGLLWRATFQQPPHLRLLCTTTTGTTGQQQSRYSRYFFWRNRNFRRIFRIVRTVSILGSLGASCFALGQISYIDDPEAFEVTYLKAIVVNNEFTKILAIDEKESAGSWLSLGKSFPAIDIEGDEELRLHRGDKLVRSAARAQRVFNKVKQAMIEKVDQQIAELERMNGKWSLPEVTFCYAKA